MGYDQTIGITYEQVKKAYSILFYLMNLEEQKIYSVMSSQHASLLQALFKGIVSRDFEWLQMILMNRLCVPDVPLAKQELSVIGRGSFVSPGRTTDRGTDFKLQRRSWRYDNASLAITLAGEICFCGQTTAPGYCTCRGKLCWRAVKAGEDSY